MLLLRLISPQTPHDSYLIFLTRADLPHFLEALELERRWAGAGGGKARNVPGHMTRLTLVKPGSAAAPLALAAESCDRETTREHENPAEKAFLLKYLQQMCQMISRAIPLWGDTSLGTHGNIHAQSPQPFAHR